ncbi:MAG: hypothetical protein AAF762_08405 [Pseudomonadota bacterium]
MSSDFVVDGNVIRLAPDAELDVENAASLLIVLSATSGNGASGPWEVSVDATDAAEEIKLNDSGVTFTDLAVIKPRATG